MSIGSAIKSTLSFVERIGSSIVGGIEKVDVVAEKIQPTVNFIGSIIKTVDPEAAPVVTAVLGMASYVEGQFATAGAATGTGTQKLAIVTAALGPLVTQTLAAAGKPNAAADVSAYISNIVNLGKNDPNLWAQLEALLNQPVTQAPAIPAAAAKA